MRAALPPGGPGRSGRSAADRRRRATRRRAGAVISASHNPPEYNGVKFFAPGGRKLVDDEEEAIESLLGQPVEAAGPVERVEGLAARYVDIVCERFGSDLTGLRVVCDCAHGALSGIAPGVFGRLGASVTAVGACPTATTSTSAAARPTCRCSVRS